MGTDCSFQYFEFASFFRLYSLNCQGFPEVIELDESSSDQSISFGEF